MMRSRSPAVVTMWTNCPLPCLRSTAGAAIQPLTERGYTLAEVARHTEAVAEYTRALAFLDQ